MSNCKICGKDIPKDQSILVMFRDNLEVVMEFCKPCYEKYKGIKRND
jgi:ribosome-binding protein aMBF1 (putative translation factor)